MNTPSHIREALPCDKPAVYALLREGFGDEEGFLCAFFSHIWQHHPVLLACTSDHPVAMAALLPCRIAPGGKDACYLYALSTAAAYRRQGHARALLDVAQKRCPHVFLHAADSNLHALYTRCGWRDCMFAQHAVFPAAKGLLPQRVHAAAYFAAREHLLHGQNHIRWEGTLRDYAHDLLCAYGGGLYLGTDAAFAVISTDHGVLSVTELIGGNAAAYAASLALSLGCKYVQSCIPCEADTPGCFPRAQCAGLSLPSPLLLGFDFD